MSEFLSTAESTVSPVTSHALGEVAVNPGVFEPGQVSEGVSIVESTLGHSGNGSDSTSKYYSAFTPVSTEVPFK